ncbi:hypothetical protein MLD38_034613 [Melastoma candidum]|uniref:Uncharacterized protein n=1 Tax=Melastoma candidum TaxID=119954 RepID=A0ACB9MB07_9MYRT|nr:hypothetical protein MLD38_034613 [Melastoma candidum]
MEDIEDFGLSALGGGGGGPLGFRLPLNSVAVATGLSKRSRPPPPASSSPNIPGTQRIYIKTFGCSNNQVTNFKENGKSALFAVLGIVGSVQNSASMTGICGK